MMYKPQFRPLITGFVVQGHIYENMQRYSYCSFYLIYSSTGSRSCDIKDWSNDAENSALIKRINYILTYIHIEDRISKFLLHFNQMNAALVSRRDFKNNKKGNYSQILTTKVLVQEDCQYNKCLEVYKSIC